MFLCFIIFVTLIYIKNKVTSVTSNESDHTHNTWRKYIKVLQINVALMQYYLEAAFNPYDYVRDKLSDLVLKI